MGTYTEPTMKGGKTGAGLDRVRGDDDTQVKRESDHRGGGVTET